MPRSGGGLIAVVVASACEPRRPGPLPLVVGEDAPTLPEEPGAERPEAKVADNGACFVCHANYKGELLAVERAKRNVGCAACHGGHRLRLRTVRWDKRTRKLPPSSKPQRQPSRRT